MASSLNEANLERRLQTVTNTQESIQTLSLWCLHHKAHYKKIIDAWMKVMKKAKSGHRLALFYLANDVIQNSKRKNVHIFNEPWMGALKQATALVKNDKIKTQIERIFKVWGDRSVYDATFIAELQALLAVEKKSHVSADEKILADFKPQKMIDKIKKHKKMESEVSMKQTQLSNLKVDVCSSESLRQLKDKAHGTKFTKEFEEATSKLEEFVQILDKQQQERISLIEMLEKGELFYNTQRKEAKIVANAYKNFGTRVSNLKQKLEERLPDLSSPVPSPTFDAPSPEDSSAECSPLKNEEENKDNVEAVDMEMSDDETDSHANQKANKAIVLPLESPTSPDTPPSAKITTPININNSTETKSPSLVPVVVDTNVKSSTSSLPTPVISNLLVASATAQPSSLDARLSSLMQNLPAFTTGIPGSFLNPNSIPIPPVPSTNNIVPGASQVQANKDMTTHAVVNDTPLRTIPLPPPLGGPSNAADGAGTPVKDEESGTGSATPLQDEEREANCATAAAAASAATASTDNQNAISEFLKKLSSSLSSAAHRSPQNNLAIGSQPSAWDQMQQSKDGGSRSVWFPDSPSNNTLNSQPTKAQLERHPPPLLPPPLPNMYFSGFSPMQRPTLNPSPKRLNTRGSYDYNGSMANSSHYGSSKKDGTASTSGITQQARQKTSLQGTLQPPPPPPPPPLFPPANPNIVELTQSHALDGTDTINSLTSTSKGPKDSTTPEECATTQMPSNLKPIPLVSFVDSEGQMEGGSVNMERTRFREAGDEKNLRRSFPTNVSKIETLSSRREPWSGNEAWGRGHGSEGIQNASREWGNVHDPEVQGHHGHYVQHRFPTGQRNFAPRHNLPPKRSWDSFGNQDGSYGVRPPPPKRLAPRSQVFGTSPRPRWRPPYPNRY